MPLGKQLDDDVIAPMTSSWLSDEELEEYFADYVKLEYKPYATNIFGYISPVVITVTVVCNVLICAVLVQKKMRSPTNLLLLAMSIADLLTGVFPAPVYLYFYTFGIRRSVFVPYPWCYAHRILTAVFPTICHTASVWLTVALSVQRYICVCHPLKAKNLCTVGKTVKVVAIIYLLAVSTHFIANFAWNFVPVEVPLLDVDERAADSHGFEVVCNASSISATSAVATEPYADNSGDVRWQSGFENFTADVAMDSCEMIGCRLEMSEFIQSHSATYHSCYFWFRVVFIHLIPCTLLVVLNFRLLISLRAAKVRRDPLLRHNHHLERSQQSESRRITLMLMVVVLVFLIVELPWAVVLVVMISDAIFEKVLMAEDDVHFMVVISSLCILISLPVNFIIYCTLGHKFRDTFLRLFCCCFCRTNHSGHGRTVATLADINGHLLTRNDSLT